MNIIRDEWTPLFESLLEKVSSGGRRRMLAEMIGSVYDATVLNFGESGEMRPSEWPLLSPKYALEKHDGDRTPTLILSGRLKGGFITEVFDNTALLSNDCEYADEHLPFTYAVNKSSNIPARPYYPVDITGERFTPEMEKRLCAVVSSHFSS